MPKFNFANGLSKIVYEPFFHFVLLGAVIFLIFTYLNPITDKNLENQIRITQGDIDRFQQIFKKQWQRLPTEAEMQGLIRAHLKEEVLYREALAMGLEKDDTIVRRRLAQKVEFLIADVTVPTEIDDVTLMEYYQKNSESYSRAAKLSFRHLYFNPDTRAERLMDEINATLKTLHDTKAGIDVAQEYGDRFMLGSIYDLASTDEIKREYGAEFAQQLELLEPGAWQGPIKSGYGLHLVYVQQRETASVYPFPEVRGRVKNDYLFELRQTRNEAVLEKLKERYEIVIENNE